MVSDFKAEAANGNFGSHPSSGYKLFGIGTCGQGDTPITDVLQVLKKNKWAIPVGIEFEYPAPEGSTWDAEIAKCVAYGKSALLT